MSSHQLAAQLGLSGRDGSTRRSEKCKQRVALKNPSIVDFHTAARLMFPGAHEAPGRAGARREDPDIFRQFFSLVFQVLFGWGNREV